MIINSFFFLFTDQQRYRLCGNIQHRPNGILQHIWDNWCATQSILSDERLAVVNFGRNVRLVQPHYCNSIKRKRAAFRDTKVYTLQLKKKKWKKKEKWPFMMLRFLILLNMLKKDCDKLWSSKKIRYNTYWKTHSHIRQSVWFVFGCSPLFYFKEKRS